MSSTIRARVKNGLLEPLEKIEFPDGCEVAVTIRRIPSVEDSEASRRAAGRWKGKVDADALIRNIYSDRLISTRPEPAL